MKPFVSVTMSAYNVEPYLRESMDCAVNQTLQDIEIICVNDGSTDGTLAILQQYAARDKRIKVVDKRVNQGLAVARNDALALASGKYIGFFDGDDLMDVDLFRKAYECAEESRADLVFWDYAVFWDKHELARQLKEPSSLTAVSPTDKVALLKRPAFAWTKLIRTDAARSLAISFPNGLTRQDIPVHWELVTQLDKIGVLPERLSYYRQQASATTHRVDWSQADLIVVYDHVKTFLEKNDLYRRYRDVFLFHQLQIFSNLYDNTAAWCRPKVMTLITERLGEDEWSYISAENELPWRVSDFYGAMRGSLPAKTRRRLWQLARRTYRSLKAAARQ